mmetsp:Transcript_38492/g.61753  ORF Transcript_38492/g.61753 Transcript_38492/m.61753 type:complete len:173 (+) Transcript_38492:45-563(+)
MSYSGQKTKQEGKDYEASRSYAQSSSSHFMNQQSTELDASQLKLGKEFHEAHCLWNAEVAVILDTVIKRETLSDRNKDLVKTTLDYVNKFKYFPTKEMAKKAREYVEDNTKPDRKGGKPGIDIEQFEVAEMANTGIFQAEEARELLPTVKEKFEGREDELEDFLSGLTEYVG